MQIEGTIDDHLVEVGRLAALKAFHVELDPKSSSVSYFSGQKRPERQRAKFARAEIPAADDSSEEAMEQRARILRRRLGFDEIHATATRAPGFSRPPIPERQILAGAIRRAISELDPLEQTWINFCYRPPGPARLEHGELFHQRFFRQYADRRLNGAKRKTIETVFHLVAVAIADYAEPNRAIFPNVKGMNRASWKKTYRPHYFGIQLELEKVDRKAVFELAEKLH